MTDDANAGYGLLIAFDESDEMFCRGFEAGRLWALAQSDADEVDEVISFGNAEMVTRIAEATGRAFRAESQDDWMRVVMGSKEAA